METSGTSANATRSHCRQSDRVGANGDPSSPRRRLAAEPRCPAPTRKGSLLVASGGCSRTSPAARQRASRRRPRRESRMLPRCSLSARLLRRWPVQSSVSVRRRARRQGTRSRGADGRKAASIKDGQSSVESHRPFGSSSTAASPIFQRRP